ncbi:MAG: DUF2007 domain-containing protein [Phycisphaerae bacterium]
MPDDPICIRRTSTVEEADIVVAWLEDRGIEATVVDRDNPGVLAFGVTDDEGIAIWVADAETADRAKALLVEHDRQHEKSPAVAASVNAVDVTCDDCGQLNSFPPKLRGTVQECSNCGTYLDVPTDDG